MLAIISQWDEQFGCLTDNTAKYAFLLIFKFGLDAAVFYLCCQKLRTSFFSVASLSIVLADLVMVLLLAAVWFLGTEKSPVPLCFILANASTIYRVVPLPMISLGLMEYWLEDSFLVKQGALCNYLKNVFFILLVWVLAITYSLCSVKAELMELDIITLTKARVCEVQESTLMTYFPLVLFTTLICSMVPFWSSITLWLKVADRISEQIEEQETHKRPISANNAEAKVSEDCLEENTWPHPPLWLSLTLCFGAFWMPYLSICVVCMVFDLGIPAYISVNALWLECTNSLLMGVVFWRKCNTLAPYSNLPENVCLWHVYWHLSKGMGHQPLPRAVFNLSNEKRDTLLYV